MAISELILSGKIKVTHARAIIQVLHTWDACSHLWKWKVSSRNAGVCGYPAALVTGIQYLDDMLSGCAFPAYPLYEKYEAKVWGVPEFARSIQQLNLAASDSHYHPYDPARKKYLQKLTLDKFFWNGFITGEPQPYTHAPFLFFYETGAVLNEDRVERAIPSNAHLFTAISALYGKLNNLPEQPTLGTREHNKLVAFADRLSGWYGQNKTQLAHTNIAIILDMVELYFRTWRKPIAIQAFASNRAYEDIIRSLEPSLCHILAVPTEYAPMIEQCSQEDYTGATTLQQIEGDRVSVFCRYAAQKDTLVDRSTLDTLDLLAEAQLSLQQLLRKYQHGSFHIQETIKQDWRELVKSIR